MNSIYSVPTQGIRRRGETITAVINCVFRRRKHYIFLILLLLCLHFFGVLLVLFSSVSFVFSFFGSLRVPIPSSRFELDNVGGQR